MGITAQKGPWTQLRVNQGHTMVVLKQQTQVLVCLALLASTVIHLALMLLMGCAQLVTIVPVGSQSERHPYMVAHQDINVLKVLTVLQDASLDTIKMNHYRTLAKNARHVTIVMLHLVE